MLLWNRTTGEIVGENIKAAAGFRDRLRGLMFSRNFPEHGGLVIRPCRGVHTFFMRYPLDILLLNAQGRIIYKKESLPPNRVTPFLRQAETAVELPGGSMSGKKIYRGDELIFFK